MDVFFGILAVMVGLAFTGLLVIMPIIAFFRARRAARVSKKNESNLHALTDRVRSLETQLRDAQDRLKQQGAQLLTLQNAGGPVPERAEPASTDATRSDAPPAVAAGPVAPPAEAPRPAAVVTSTSLPLVVPSSPEVPPKTAASVASPSESPATSPSAPQVGVTHHKPLPVPSFNTAGNKSAQAPAGPSLAKRALNLEEVLGKDWLNKIGIMCIVIGLASLMGNKVWHFGPAGKLFCGFAVSFALLAGGLFFERRERWRILARAGMGGGWALLYFTTYAMNHIAATRVLESEALDFVFLMLVAGFMVAHTLRYHSRVVSGMAFLLAFSTINISHAGATSLIASAILAVALVVVVGKRRWFNLEVLAILALFLNHYLWLRPIIEPMGGHHHPFPELVPSTLLLFAYWLIFRFSYLWRRVEDQNEENISTVAALMNTFLFHGLIKYQSVHPELAFWFLLGVGAIEFTLAQLPVTRRRRTAFVILSTLGAMLLVAAFPYRYSGGQLSIIWLAEAEALFLAGVFTPEILFRWLGIGVELLVAGHMFLVDTHNLDVLRDSKGVDFSDPGRTVMFLFAALMIFVNSYGVPRRWPDLLKDGFEKKFFRFQVYLAGLLLLAAVWAFCTEAWLAVGFAACALALAVLGAQGEIDEISVLANAFAVLGFLRVICANFAVVEVARFNANAVVTICFATALLYAAARWIAIPISKLNWRIPDAYTWVATFVVALLAWYQLWTASVALGWGLIGLVVFQLGFERRSASFRLQSYALFLASFLRLFVVNFNAEVPAGLLSPRLYTALPLALVFYFAYARLESKGEEFLAIDTRIRAGEFICYLGTITVAAAMRFELPPDWIAAAWAGLVCLFILIARLQERQTFLTQAFLLGVAVFLRTFLHNFYQRSYFPAPSIWWGGWMTTGSVIALMFVALLMARRLSLPRPENSSDRGGELERALASLHRNPSQLFFFIAFILLTGLLYVELHARGMSTVAWGVEAVGVFLFALALKERSFRLSALLLLLVCVAKIACIDVWSLTPIHRDLTFIVLGIALFSVSYLYTRYPEVLRAYL